jgi:cytochrome b561
VAVALVLLYARSAANARPIASNFTYSALLRHIHLLMAVGLLGCVGSIQFARRSENPGSKVAWMGLHKSGGVLMLGALVVRIAARLGSTIPPRFPGPSTVKLVETVSHGAFYLLCAGMGISGVTMGYFGGKGVPFFGSTLVQGKSDPSSSDARKAAASHGTHLLLGKLMQYIFLPYHLTGNAVHWMQGRDIVRKISPFI